MSSTHIFPKQAFTLVEMLIIIVIIGILTAALTLRVIWLQASARDTVRDTDLKTVATAIEVYYSDNGTYPIPQYIAFLDRHIAFHDIIVPSAFAQTVGSSLDTLDSKVLSSYLKSLPHDLNTKGLKNDSSGNCIVAGNSYAYYSDGSNYYAITAFSEAKKGNASSCGNIIDHIRNGRYKKVGKGLTTNFPGSKWTPDNCFTASSGVLNGYVNNNVNTITSCMYYNGNQGINIPDSINWETITSIWHLAFSNQTVLELTIPSSITSIWHTAFSSASISWALILPSSLIYMWYSAFSNNNITSLTIPSSLTNIWDMVFFSNKITSLTIPPSVTSIWQSAFQQNRLTSLTIPPSVTSIWNRAFYQNNLTSLTIPSSVTSIWFEAFYLNNLTSITIPDSVTTIWPNVFSRNWPNRNSSDITDFIPGTNQTRNLVGTTWVKQ